MELIHKSIFDFGAKGDGISDDSAAFNEAFSGGFFVTVPAGEYCIRHTVRIGSDTTVEADEKAHIFLGAGAQKLREDFLIATKPGAHSSNISISGGIWDGNCANNDRGPDFQDPFVTSGTLINFRDIDHLTLSHMTVKNPLCYYFRFCEAEYVTIHDIRFMSETLRTNQDGLHFAGFCRHFRISDLSGGYGAPNDDFLAFNADDALNRQENYDVSNGPIEDFEVENVHSDYCHCFIRLLSVNSPIRNIRIRHITGVTYHCLLNMDMARHCRIQLFREEDYPDGVGFVENVEISDVAVSHVNPEDTDDVDATFSIMGNVKNLILRDVRITDGTSDLLTIDKMADHRILMRGIKGLKTQQINAPGLSVTPKGIAGTISHTDTVSVRLAGFEELEIDRME